LSFDHGAQYATVRDSRFRAFIDALHARRSGLVQRWMDPIVSLRGGVIERRSSATERLVFCPGMSALGRHLAEGLDVQIGRQVVRLERAGGTWTAVCADESRHESDVLLLTLPSPQIRTLLPRYSALQRQLAEIEFAPCWAVLVVFETGLGLPYAGAFVQDSPLGWIANNGRKPGRIEPPNGQESWVLHGSGPWSSSNLDLRADEIGTQLLRAFATATGSRLPAIQYLRTHLWRYALPVRTLDCSALWSNHDRIGAGGDWCRTDARIEGAYLSGLELAHKVLRDLA
jgi:predicted NAD/FAD-dependent oxidoreductase